MSGTCSLRSWNCEREKNFQFFILTTRPPATQAIGTCNVLNMAFTVLTKTRTQIIQGNLVHNMLSFALSSSPYGTEAGTTEKILFYIIRVASIMKVLLKGI